MHGDGGHPSLFQEEGQEAATYEPYDEAAPSLTQPSLAKVNEVRVGLRVPIVTVGNTAFLNTKI